MIFKLIIFVYLKRDWCIVYVYIFILVVYNLVIYFYLVYINIIKVFLYVMIVGVCIYEWCILKVKDFENLKCSCNLNLRFLILNIYV